MMRKQKLYAFTSQVKIYPLGAQTTTVWAHDRQTNFGQFLIALTIER